MEKMQGAIDSLSQIHEQASHIISGAVQGLSESAWVTFNVLGEEFHFKENGEFRVSIAPRIGEPVSVSVVDYSTGQTCESFGAVNEFLSDITDLVVRCTSDPEHEEFHSMFWFCLPPFAGVLLIFIYFLYRRGVRKTFTESWHIMFILLCGFLTMLANSYTRDNAGSGYKPLETSRRWAFENTMFLMDVEDFLGFKSEMGWQQFWLAITGDRFWNLVYMILDAACAGITVFAAGTRSGKELWVARTSIFWGLIVCVGGMLMGSLFPVMPPRLLNSCTQYGACNSLHVVIKDTLVSAGHPEGHHGADQNMYMAVPSFHVVFMVFAWGALEDLKLKLLPPIVWIVLTILVWWSTIVTGNHIWMDGILSCIVVIPVRMAFYWAWDKFWGTTDAKWSDPFPEIEESDDPNEYAGLEVQLSKIVIYSISLTHILVMIPLLGYCLLHPALFQSNLVTVAVLYSFFLLYQLKFKYYDQLSNLPSPFSSRSRQLMWFCLGFLVKIAVWWFAVTLAFHSILRYSRALPWHARERTADYTYHKLHNQDSEITIPKVIHQTQDIYRQGGTNLSSLHYETELPDWEYSVWTNEEVRHLIENSYPWFLETWDNSYTEEMRRVSSRYFILHKFGGVYVDNNLLVTSKFNFESYFRGHQMLVAESPHYGVTGDFMAGIPNHPFLTRLLRELKETRNDWEGFPEDLRTLANTGGHFLTLKTEVTEFKDVAVMRARDWVPVGFIEDHEHSDNYCEVSGNTSQESGCFLCEDQPLFAYLHGETWKSFILTSLKPVGVLLGGFFKHLFITFIVVYITGPQAWISILSPFGQRDSHMKAI